MASNDFRNILHTPALGIFRPSYLGCPVCNTDRQRHTAFAVSAHQQLADGKLKGHCCGHEFTLFEALRAGCHETFGILATFSHWQWSKKATINVGRLSKIPVPTPATIKLFAAFLTPYGSQLFYLPHVLDLNGPELLISTTATTSTPPEMLGKEMCLTVSVYGYNPSESRGWVRLLYESLTDYSEHRYAMAVFKLATSVEIACDRTLEIYLGDKLVQPSLIQHLLNSSRNWHARMNRVRDLASFFLQHDELEAFQEAATKFLETVRKYRNAFAHDDPDVLDHDQASDAFEICFPLFWGIERIIEKIGLVTNQTA